LPEPPCCCSRGCAGFNIAAMATPAAVLEAIDRVLEPLLETLERVMWV
jgi:hypothetical protein